MIFHRGHICNFVFPLILPLGKIHLTNQCPGDLSSIHPLQTSYSSSVEIPLVPYPTGPSLLSCTFPGLQSFKIPVSFPVYGTRHPPSTSTPSRVLKYPVTTDTCTGRRDVLVSGRLSRCPVPPWLCSSILTVKHPLLHRAVHLTSTLPVVSCF